MKWHRYEPVGAFFVIKCVINFVRNNVKRLFSIMEQVSNHLSICIVGISEYTLVTAGVVRCIILFNAGNRYALMMEKSQGLAILGM